MKKTKAPVTGVKRAPRPEPRAAAQVADLPKVQKIEIDLPIMFASSAMNGLIVKAEEADSFKNIVDASWEISDLMVAEVNRRAKLADKQLSLPLGSAVAVEAKPGAATAAEVKP